MKKLDCKNVLFRVLVYVHYLECVNTIEWKTPSDSYSILVARQSVPEKYSRLPVLERGYFDEAEI